MSTANVNLLSPASGISVGDVALWRRLRTLSLGAVILFIAISITSGALFFLFQAQLSSLKQQEKGQMDRISALAQVEGYQRLIESRLVVLERIIGRQRDWKSFLSLLTAVRGGGSLRSISVDEQTPVVRVVFIPMSIELARDVVANTTRLAQSREISNARVESVALDALGTITLAVSFVY